MKKFKLLALTGAIAALCSAAASAAPVITSVTASGPGCAVAADCTGSFSSTIHADNRSIDLTKAFSSVNPITLTFHVVHQQGGGPSYDITEAITNNTGVAFTDFHFAINEPANANGVVFTSFNQSTLGGFSLDSPPSSGPRNLNFTGLLANGSTASAGFNLSPFDPGNGGSYDFTITQTATIPEPGTWGILMAGLIGVIGVARRRLNV